MSNSFEIGMKVSLDGEFGVVIKSEYKGMIKWDNPIENDFEDWHGLFGTFIQVGGKILNENYQLKYINNDGTLKDKINLSFL